MIKKAVIPAAGLGTRFLPATKAQPKEMLPIIDTPVIQYVVQECVDSGIEDILIISGKGKRSIEDHFDRNFELEARFQEKDDESLFNQLRHIENMAHIHFIRQKELNGLGDAIYHARFHCGNEPFAVLLGDTIIDSVIPATQQMIDTFEQYRQPIIAVENVPAEKVSRYGIVGGTMISKKLLQLNEMIEKPAVDKAPSTLAVAGRYILTPDIFPILEKTPRGKGNEIQLTDALRILLKHHGIMAQIIEGKRHDLGDKLEFLKTTIEFALKRDEFAKPLREFLKQIIREK
ncbi:MAG: UTP-glucose-1-phosphate uridylyltransferase [Bacteroidetes bacterium]|jgi:UTP--glucose-1-phosphate uridylyltransferase|nr:UTP-glucose-1-phosphate uridylyltransferase [Bacteroidota bacterium]